MLAAGITPSNHRVVGADQLELAWNPCTFLRTSTFSLLHCSNSTACDRDGADCCCMHPCCMESFERKLTPEVGSICMALQVQQAQALQLRNELQLRGAGVRGPADVEVEVAQAAPALVSSQPN